MSVEFDLVREYRRQLIALSAQKDDVYKQALELLKLEDTAVTFDYFYNGFGLEILQKVLKERNDKRESGN